MNANLSPTYIKDQIYILRGQPVILDYTLAQFYQIETEYLNRVVKRHKKRFQEHFMFQLLRDEYKAIMIKSHGGTRNLPYAFTQEGIGMLSSVLKTDRAIQVNTAIIHAYLKLRSASESNENTVSQHLNKIENQLDRILELLTIPHPLQPRQNPVNVGKSEPITPPNPPRTEDHIQTLVATNFRLKPKDLSLATREKSIALPRQIAMYLIRKHTPLSLKAIAKFFRLKDHTTVVHACQKIETSLSKQGPLTKQVNTIEEQLAQKK
jgi:predicted Zn-ribbon and HTH transcriptional regulator